MSNNEQGDNIESDNNCCINSLCEAPCVSGRGGKKAEEMHQQGSRGRRSLCRASPKEKREECQGKHPVFPLEGNAEEKEKQALAETEGCAKRSVSLVRSQSAASLPKPSWRRAS